MSERCPDTTVRAATETAVGCGAHSHITPCATSLTVPSHPPHGSRAERPYAAWRRRTSTSGHRSSVSDGFDMASVTARALRSLRTDFRRIVEAMKEMHPRFEVRPSEATSVLQPEAHAGGTVTIHASPVVCRVPERATHRAANLYIVFEGRVTIASSGGDDLRTVNYSTNFG